MSSTPVSNYDQPEVVEEFRQQTELSGCEDYVFDKYCARGGRVLDLGVGAGRTTPFLAARASRYVGLDFAPRMIEACRKRFPELDFVVGDAADLSAFADESFDVVVFSFNGIDYLPSDEARARCLRECRRVLAADGLLILSAHNARGILMRPQLKGVPVWKKMWRVVYSAVHSVGMIKRAAFAPSFFSGHGYIWEPAAGGCRQHMATRDFMESELRTAGFNIVETVPHHYPARTMQFTTPWFYYVGRRA